VAGCCLKRQFDGKSKRLVNPKEEGLAGNSSLKRVDLTGTSIDFKGLESILRESKALVTVSVDDDLW
jgi:hypothetical protein